MLNELINNHCKQIVKKQDEIIAKILGVHDVKSMSEIAAEQITDGYRIYRISDGKQLGKIIKHIHISRDNNNALLEYKIF